MINNINKPFSFYVFTLFLIGFFDYLIHDKYFPLNQGWWEILSVWHNDGYELYKDVKILFPPLHIEFMGIIFKLANSSFLIAQKFGIIFHLIQVSALFLFLKKVSNQKYAAITTLIITCLLINNENLYMIKDYQQSVTLFASLALFFIVLFEEKNTSNSKYILIFLTGICSGILFGIKQNFAIFYFLAILLGLIFNFKHYKIGAQLFLFLFSGLVIPLIYISINYDSSWITVYYVNEAKGSVVTVLFRFFLDKSIVLVNILSLIYALIFNEVFLNRNLKKYLSHISPFFKEINYKFLFIYVFIFIFILGALLKNFEAVFKFNLYALSIGYILNFFISSIINRKRIPLFLFPLISIIYIASNASSYSISNLEIPIAFLITTQLHKLYFLKKNIYVFILMLIILSIFVLNRHSRPMYDWHSYYVSPLSFSKNEVKNIDTLNGFKVDDFTFKVINEINNYQSQNYKLFAHPSIPIAYYINNKKPLVNNPMLWFDLSSERDGIDAVEKLNLSNPNVILWYRQKSDTFVNHLKLRKMNSATLIVDDWIIDKIKSGDYFIKKAYLNLPVNGFDIFNDSFRNLNFDFYEFTEDNPQCNTEKTTKCFFRNFNDAIQHYPDALEIDPKYPIFYVIEKR